MIKNYSNKIASRVKGAAVCFLMGGAGYCLLEVLWRGHTHYSMFVAGGLCLLLLLRLSKSGMSFAAKCVCGGACITAVELAIGCVVNLWLGMDVWDYSMRRFNMLGQVCLPFSALWCALSGCVFASLQLLRKERSAPGFGYRAR